MRCCTQGDAVNQNVVNQVQTGLFRGGGGAGREGLHAQGCGHTIIMADGPRCQRRKHTQNSVRSLRSVPEATSDSDDEDKLHIVEEDSINDDSDQKPTVLQLKASRQDTVGQDDGSLGPDALIQEIRVKEECVTDEEDEGADIKVTSDEQQQSEMKAIYPDTPDEHKSTPERGVHDENGTPEAFSHLYTCPHCSRGYKRQTSLKEHIKLRHEKSDDNYCCSLCSYTFTYRTQLVRHMTAHKHIREQRNNSQSGGNRKFKCTECSKAFKYKHHLKEHLRIHSGEKPYECSNCQKRFSHSGSYSSHISSKKCASVTSTVNGLPRSPEAKTTLTLSRPTPILLKEKVEVTSKPLQEQLPLKQIKQEPVEHQTKPVLASTALTTTTNGVVQATAPQGVVQTLVLPTVGLVQPISINLSDLQNALNAAMDGNVTRPVLVSTSMNGTNAKIIGQAQSQAVVLQPQTQPQVISAFSVPVVGQDGNAKIFINYNPQLGPQLKNAMNAKTSQPVVEQSTVTKPSVEQTSTAQVKSTVTEVTQPPVVQGNSTQSNQTQTSLNPKPTQVSIVRPIQAANPNKPPSIIKITPAQAARLVQARAAQPKFTQQTLLLVRRADGTQSLVVRQVAVANPNTQSTPTADTKAGDINSTPAIMAMSPEKKQTTENSSLEEVSKLTENIKIKTEPDSPSKSDSNMEADGEKDTHTNGNKEEGKHTTHEDKLTFSHSGTVHSGVACGDNFHNYATCLVCDKSPGKRNGMDGLSGDAKESPTTISLTSLLDKDKSGAAERLLPLLKAYSQNPQPTEDQLSQVAKTVRLPIEAVSKWYQRMRSKKILLQGENNLKNKQQEKTSINSTPNTQCYTPPKSPDDTSTDAQNRLQSTTPSPVPSPISVSTDDLKVIVKTEDVEEELQSEPLDLSLPKSTPTEANVTAKLPISAQKEPLNLTCLKKQELTGNTIYVAQAGTGPINIMGTSLPTLVAIAEPGGIPCIGATVSANKRTIFIPQLTYTYNSNVNTTNSTAVNTKGMVVINSCLKATEATVTESVSGKEDQNDDDSPVQKKRKKISGGLYACNLCDKMFQKSSSLLRHKYEHTGKRPYECGICQKAFKHKHHLIEHTRLHSGEKPYMCDKCGKRFSHSGSYSQHMNHRYSYCKRESNEHTEPHSTPTPSSHLDSDDRESDGEEEEDFSGLDMSDIRVVRVGEDYDDEEESGGEEQQENTQEEDRHAVVEVELGDIDTLEEEVWETMETEDTEESREESGYGEGDLNHEESAEMATEEQESE